MENRIKFFSNLRNDLDVAPREVKLAFNRLIRYFDTEEHTMKDIFVQGCRIKYFPGGLITLNYLNYTLTIMTTDPGSDVTITKPDNTLDIVDKGSELYIRVYDTLLNGNFIYLAEPYIALINSMYNFK